MRKIFIKYFLIIMIVTVGFTILVNSLVQTVFARINTKKAGKDVISSIAERIENNNEIIDNLISDLNENYIVRTRAFSEIIDQNPEIIYDRNELVRLAKLLNVEELHVTDENGVLSWSNIDDYLGLDFRTTDQTRPFLPALTDKSFELAQEPQKNGGLGKLFQYISVARYDKTGIVQVGVSPEIVDNALANNKIDVVISNFNVDIGQHVYAIDKNTGKILADSKCNYIGKNYSDIGIEKEYFNLSKDSGMMDIDGEKVFAVFDVVDDYIIAVTYTENRLYTERENQNIVAAVSSILLGLIIIIAIFFLLKNVIINNIDNINGYLKKIGDGDLNVSVDISTTPEFVMLSEGINEMTSSIKSQMTKIKNQAEELEESNESILSSLKYARKIQENLLPLNSSFDKAFSDYSILWEPKDVVGGDIYWIKNFNSGTLLCVCDCTGHGTPGALLTMLVVSCLDSIATEENANNTALIMWELEKKLSNTLNAADNTETASIKDGADISILFIKNDKEVIISSANTHVFVCNGNDVKRIKGQKLRLGEGNLKDKQQIDEIVVSANKNNKFYIASDGLFDQIGGEGHVPFGYKKFKQIILENHNEKQVDIVQKVWYEFKTYMGNENRRDDITLVSFKI